MKKAHQIAAKMHAKNQIKIKEVKKQPLFHISTRGFGSQTRCGIPIRPFGNGRKGDPNWGGQTPYSSTTCVACVIAYIADKSDELNDAIQVLAHLTATGQPVRYAVNAFTQRLPRE